jgi:glycerophosphoryl diester phosphodiesterase family protein
MPCVAPLYFGAVLLVAHRSPRTRAGCLSAAEAGATVFEVDVQIWHGRLVVSHYLPLLRSGFRRDGWRVVRSWNARREPPLADVAELVPPDGVVLLDLKEQDRGRRADLLAAIVATLPASGRYLCCTSIVEDLNVLRDKGFRTWRTVGDQRQLAAVLAAGAVADEAVTVNHKLLSGDVVDRLHSLTDIVVAWTVNNVQRALSLRDIGVEGVTTDSLDVMRALR